MATKYEVRVTDASVTGGRYRTTCACTCGWQGTVEDYWAPGALSAAARARGPPPARGAPQASPRVFFRPRAAARYRHPRALDQRPDPAGPALSAPRRVCLRLDHHGPLRSPRGTGHRARERHQAHVDLQTGRTPGRDYLVMAGLVVLMAALLIGLAMIAIQAGGGDFSSLLG